VARQERVLLRFRVLERSQSGVHRFCHRSHHSCNLHSAMCRGPSPPTYPVSPDRNPYWKQQANAGTELQLVVAIHLHRRRLRLLGLPLLRLVLLHQTAHPRLRLRPPVLLLQPLGLHRLWSSNGHRRLLDRVRICEADIWVSCDPFLSGLC